MDQGNVSKGGDLCSQRPVTNNCHKSVTKITTVIWFLTPMFFSDFALKVSKFPASRRQFFPADICFANEIPFFRGVIFLRIFGKLLFFQPRDHFEGF